MWAHRPGPTVLVGVGLFLVGMVNDCAVEASYCNLKLGGVGTPGEQSSLTIGEAERAITFDTGPVFDWICERYCMYVVAYQGEVDRNRKYSRMVRLCPRRGDCARG